MKLSNGANTGSDNKNTKNKISFSNLREKLSTVVFASVLSIIVGCGHKSEDENQAPIAVNDKVSNNVVVGQEIIIDVLLNDSDPDGDSLNVTNLRNIVGGTGKIVDNKVVAVLSEQNLSGEYDVSDGKGGVASASFVIENGEVVDETAPEITLNGESEIHLNIGEEYIEEGAFAIDNIDGEVTVLIEGEVDISMPGVYERSYTAKDSAENTSVEKRTINVHDNVAPEITLNGASEITLNVGEEYIEEGATAFDNIDGELTVQTIGTVNTAIPGAYEVTYKAVDLANNEAIEIRTINIIDPQKPEITLNGDAEITLGIGDQYVEEGATAYDNVDGVVDVVITGEVDTTKSGENIVTYTAIDSSNNTSTTTRTVNVKDLNAPVIELNGAAVMNLNVGDTYTELGATATDIEDGVINVIIIGTVDTSIPGETIVTYTAEDSAGNKNEKTRKIIVIDANGPQITLNGAAVINLNIGDIYEELGATAFDNVDGNVAVEITGEVDTTIPGEYIRTYSSIDSSNNESSKTRIVNVIDPEAPTITLNGAAEITLNVGDTYTEQGATATDNVDGNVDVVIGGDTVDTGTVGEYIVTYTAIDSSDNESVNTRTVNVVVPPNVAPEWTQDTYNTGLTITDGTNNSQTILDLTSVSSDENGDTISYSIVSISAPSEQIEWENSIMIENGELLVKNLMTNDPATPGTVTVTVRVSDNNLSNDADVIFNYDDVQ